jgi:predicted methyltransferase MtxX (methanogen marker protein 4)
MMPTDYGTVRAFPRILAKPSKISKGHQITKIRWLNSVMEVKKRMGEEGAINKLSHKKNIGEMEDSGKINEIDIWLGEGESEKKKYGGVRVREISK